MIPLDHIGTVESDDYPGFYYPKGIKGVLVSLNGDVFCQDTNKILKIHLGNHGYLNVKKTSFINDKSVRLSFLIHRLIAFAFIDVPVQYLALRFSKIQINHKDGIKTNNSIGNLEFCSAKENVRHAFSNSLIGIGRSVLVRNLQTGEIEKFSSIAACSLRFEIPSITLRRHLSSPFAGLKTKDWKVFKYDDNNPWPYIDPIKTSSDTLYLTSVVVVKNEVTDKILIFNTIKSACLYLNLNYTAIKNFRRYSGIDQPYKGWLFKECDSSELTDLSGVIFKRSKFGRESNRYYSVRNIINGTITYFKGFNEMAEQLDYSTIHLTNTTAAGNGRSIVGDFEIQTISENEYQGQDGIVLPKV